MPVTKHAKKRMKERCGIGKSSSDNVAQKALVRGIKHCQTSGNLKKYIDSLYFKNNKANNIRLYGQKVYIFHNDVLITVLQLPGNLIKDYNNIIRKTNRRE